MYGMVGVQAGWLALISMVKAKSNLASARETAVQGSAAERRTRIANRNYGFLVARDEGVRGALGLC